MKIKTFQTPTMHDAIRTIKHELGPDAVILSTKQIRTGGVLGMFGKTMVEVTAATDMAPVPPSRRQPFASLSTTHRPIVESGEERAAQHVTFQDGLRAKAVPQDASGPPRSTSHDGWSNPDRTAAPGGPGGQREWDLIKEELRILRKLMESSYREARPEHAAGLDGLPARLLVWHDEFLRQGLARSTAQRIVRDVAERHPPSELESDSAVRQALHRDLVRRIKVSGPLLDLGEWKKTVILTGPTGVGKTTTIAKLAAHYKLNEQRSVSLITLDTYRVAAVEQLRMYANILGITMDVALTKREALECIRKRSKSELILIDTAGRSPRDAAGMEELRQLTALDHPLEIHLVLSATTREQDLKEGLTRYAGIPLHRLLFTKLDETTGFGNLLELMEQTGLPLSYFSVGQNVPEDLEVARPERLADLLLGGDLRPTTNPSRDAR